MSAELDHITKPTKQEQQLAMESHQQLANALKLLKVSDPEIEIEETQEKIKVPLKALQLLAKILEVTSQGKPISIVPIAIEMTTQAAADMLGCSRPHLVKLLEKGEIAYTKIGKHRRVNYNDVRDYKLHMKNKQRDYIVEIMNADQELGLYDDGANK